MVDPKFSIAIGKELSVFLDNCIEDSIQRESKRLGVYGHPIDLRVHYQKNKDFVYPTFVIKFSKSSRYIYLNGGFSYALIGSPTMQYYDCVRLRSLPLEKDWKNAMLVENYGGSSL